MRAAEFPPFPPSANYDQPPRFVSGLSPVYPITAALGGRTGGATVEFVIAEDGTTREHAVISSDEPSYGTHIIIAVREWKFSPALKAGRAVAVKVRHEVKFGFR